MKKQRSTSFYWLTFLLCTIVLCSKVTLHAQTNINIDELDSEIKHLTPNEKVDIYLQCYEYFVKLDLKRAQGYNTQAFDLLKLYPDDLKLGICYYNFGYMNRILGNYDEAMTHFTEGIRIFKKTGGKVGLAFCYNNKGIIYKNKNEFVPAMKCFNQALKLCEEINHQVERANILNNIGNIYTSQGDYENAIASFEKCRKLNKEGDYSVLNNLGAAYSAYGDREKALKYYKKSLAVAVKQEDIRFQSPPLGNIGSIYLQEENYEKALKYFKKGQVIEEKLELKNELISTYSNIGNAYRMVQNYVEALIYFEKAEELVERTNDKPTQKKIYISMALAYEESGNYISAIDYLYKINSLNKDLFDLEKNRQVEELLAKFEIKSKEKELILIKKDRELQLIELEKNEAKLEHQQLQAKLEHQKQESKIILLHQHNALQELSLQKNEIEREDKAKQILVLTQEAELQEIKFEKEQAELRQDNLIKNIAIGVAGLLIIVAIILIILYQQKLKAVELLNLKTEEVNKQQIYALIREQEFASVQANMEGQAKERQRISQDLHDGIGGNLASIKLNLANIIEKTQDPKLHQVMRNVDDTYHEVRSISHNLAPAKMLNQAFIQLIQNFITEITNNKLLNIQLTAFPEDAINELPSELKIELYRIIQELISNVMKYAHAETVDIQLNLRDGHVNLMVEDDGVGFDTNKASTGIGLSNIKARIKALNGVVHIESAIGRWSLVNIEIPVNTHTVEQPKKLEYA